MGCDPLCWNSHEQLSTLLPKVRDRSLVDLCWARVGTLILAGLDVGSAILELQSVDIEERFKASATTRGPDFNLLSKFSRLWLSGDTDNIMDLLNG